MSFGTTGNLGTMANMGTIASRPLNQASSTIAHRVWSLTEDTDTIVHNFLQILWKGTLDIISHRIWSRQYEFNTIIHRIWARAEDQETISSSITARSIDAVKQNTSGGK